ncbi:hypothetical protein R6Q57_020241 [Mikania cordata]
MALDPLLSDSISKLTGIVIYVATTTPNFKSELGQLQQTLLRIAPIIDDVGKWGWHVPILPVGIVAFDEPLKKLKAKVLEDGNECAVVVVAAAGGCGKTTLVTVLCDDSDIKASTFEENIFFVTVSETPNFMVIVNDLFNPNSSSQPILFQSNEDAKNKLGNFLLDKESRPMLLVLDDVWDHSFIDNFPLKIRVCKILVTSRSTFPKFDVFRFDPLSGEDAKILFCRSTFTESKK